MIGTVILLKETFRSQTDLGKMFHIQKHQRTITAATARGHSAPTRMAEVRETDTTKCRQNVEELELSLGELLGEHGWVKLV